MNKMSNRGAVLWRPPGDQETVIGRFLKYVNSRRDLDLASYDAAWEWSVEHLEDFWGDLADFMGIRFHSPPRAVTEGEGLLDTEWFPGATLNYAEQVLRAEGSQVAVVAHSEARPVVRMSRAELRRMVAAAQDTLRQLGVGPGDRVAAYVPNCPEAVVALLAVTSLGAIWTSCPPEFGAKSVIDRFAQVEPRLLITVDGYRFGGRSIDRAAEIAAIRRALPSLTETIWIPYLDAENAGDPGFIPWADVVRDKGQELTFTPVSFSHPLWIVYTSGTTGLPKAIIHGHGGIVLEHYKWLALQDDAGSSDRFFWYSSTAWMAWNASVYAVALGGTLVTLDGDIRFPKLESFWELMGAERVTYMGISPGFLLLNAKAGIRPSAIADLTSLQTVATGGSPCTADIFEWVYENVNPRLYMTSTSGGTDVASAFVGGCRLLPVRAGEIGCRWLGVDAQAFDPAGSVVIGERGELVVRTPMPSMPLGFWGDPDGARYRRAYFERFPGVWCHGDWIEFTEDGSCFIYGRSDATLNRGGVRLGTSEFYSVIETIEGISDCLVVHMDEIGTLGELILFVSLESGRELDDQLRTTISQRLARELSPRHVPDQIHVVDTIPRTGTGKRLEVPVKNILRGMSVSETASVDSLTVPGSLAVFEEIRDRRLKSVPA